MTAPASGAAAAQKDQALVRVVNAAPDELSVDVIAQDSRAFHDVDYAHVTPYRLLSANARDFKLASTDNEREALAEHSASMSRGRHYTLLAFPGLEPQPGGNQPARDDAQPPQKLQLRVIADDLQPPSSGKARVRVVNAAPDAPAVAVFVGDNHDPLFSDVTYMEAASYKEIEPTSGTLEVRPVQTTAMTSPTATGSAIPKRDTEEPAPAQPPAATKDVHLDAGRNYTLIVARDTQRGRLNTIVVEDVLNEPVPVDNTRGTE